ncbi:MAG: hypothetical protein Q4C42_12225 [Clostridia bacterium]|nr:hypothetical protein [Clostridia bacterium]
MNENFNTDNNPNYNPLEELCNAIVLQAVKDYREAKIKLSYYGRDYEAKRMLDECLRFFRSGWFGLLTDLDPEFLIERLDKE